MWTVHRGRVLAHHIKRCATCHNERKPYFCYHSTSIKCNYDELKLMLGFLIWISLEPDLFNWIRILQGAMGVHGAIFMLAFQLKSKLWQIRRIWDTWFYIYGSTAQWTVALKRPIFKQKKGFANLSLGLIYYSIASSQPPSRDTVPLRFPLYFYMKLLSLAL
jgi:hypothetical protein